MLHRNQSCKILESLSKFIIALYFLIVSLSCFGKATLQTCFHSTMFSSWGSTAIRYLVPTNLTLDFADFKDFPWYVVSCSTNFPLHVESRPLWGAGFSFTNRIALSLCLWYMAHFNRYWRSDSNTSNLNEVLQYTLDYFCKCLRNEQWNPKIRVVQNYLIWNSLHHELYTRCHYFNFSCCKCSSSGFCFIVCWVGGGGRFYL